MNRHSLIQATLALAVAGLSTTAWAVDRVDQSFEMSADGRVTVQNTAGDIEIVGWDKASAHVIVEPGKTAEDIEIKQSSGGLRIEVINRNNSRGVDDTEIFLRVPKGATLEVEGVSSDIDVSGMSNQSISLETVSGDLTVEASTGKLELTSVSGDVEFNGSSSRTSVDAVSGEVVLVGVSGEVNANSVSGDISVEAGEVDQGRFEAVSGDMRLELAVADGGRLGCDSMSGDTMLRLPSGQQARFSAQSFSGTIGTDFGESSQVSRGNGEVLDHLEGDNGAKIRIESFSGDISIRSR